MSLRTAIVCAVLTSLVLAGGVAGADIVKLVNGRVMEGKLCPDSKSGGGNRCAAHAPVQQSDRRARAVMLPIRSRFTDQNPKRRYRPNIRGSQDSSSL